MCTGSEAGTLEERGWFKWECWPNVTEVLGSNIDKTRWWIRSEKLQRGRNMAIIFPTWIDDGTIHWDRKQWKRTSLGGDTRGQVRTCQTGDAFERTHQSAKFIYGVSTMQLAVEGIGLLICNKGKKKNKHNSPFLEACAVPRFCCLFLLTLSFVWLTTPRLLDGMFQYLTFIVSWPINF